MTTRTWRRPLVAECVAFTLGILAGLAMPATAQHQDICRQGSAYDPDNPPPECNACEDSCSVTAVYCDYGAYQRADACHRASVGMAQTDCRIITNEEKRKRGQDNSGRVMTPDEWDALYTLCVHSMLNGELAFSLELSWPPAIPVEWKPGLLQACKDTHRDERRSCEISFERCWSGCGSHRPSRPQR